MGEKIALGNGRFSDFQRLVTLILDRVILHTILHHSSTSTYILNVIEIKETFFVDGRTFETHFIRSTRSRPKNYITLKNPSLHSHWISWSTLGPTDVKLHGEIFSIIIWQDTLNVVRNHQPFHRAAEARSCYKAGYAVAINGEMTETAHFSLNLCDTFSQLYPIYLKPLFIRRLLHVFR